MSKADFNPEVPPQVGAQVCIKSGEFEGYTGEITSLDFQVRVVYFRVMVFERPVNLSLAYDTAAEILAVISDA